MFDLLKKKVAGFIGSLAGKEEAKIEEKTPEPAAPLPPEPTPAPIQEPEQKIEPIPEPVKHEHHEPKPEPITQPIPRPAEPKPIPVVTKPAPKPEPRQEPKQEHATPKPEPAPQSQRYELTRPTMTPKPVAEQRREEQREEQRNEQKERDIAPRFGILAKVKSLITQEYEITEKDAEPFFEGLEIALLESDVSYDTAQHLVADIHGRIVGRKVSRGAVQDALKQEVRTSFRNLFSTEPFNLANYVAAQKASGEPTVILFVGPNGAGKTTTIAKLASWLATQGHSSIIAAGDTFRKAAIEQASIHGEKLGVRVVKHTYGADPTAVAFDAVAAAKANKIDVVLIDTAGRQETNTNLVREMQKIERVIKPQLKIFIGEAIAGNALAEQAKSFNEAIKLDGIILTKMDCDAKGGGSFSVAYETKLPILFMGVGQEYGDLRPFDADWITDNVFAA